MKISAFHLMPHRELPADFEQRYESVWVTPPWWELADARRVGQYYNWTLDELLHAARSGGVVRDIHSWGLENPINPELYMPIGQWSWSAPFFVLAIEGNPTGVAGNVREQLRAVDPDLPLSSV